MSCLNFLKKAECRSVKMPGVDDLPDHQTTTMSRVRAVIRGNRRLTDREIADEVGNSIGSCHQILT